MIAEKGYLVVWIPRPDQVNADHWLGAGRQHLNFDYQDEGARRSPRAQRRRPTQHLQ